MNNNMNNFEFCKEVVSSNPNIAGAKIIQNGELVAIYSRPHTLVPSPDRFGRPLLQVNIMWSMIKSNEDFLAKITFLAFIQKSQICCFFPYRVST